ncbi:MAG: acyltransferase [Bacteroides sp.]|nr:acyltransferase [Bacteroides sp.]MCM1095483.1 acyltransferase [Terasakiella sp.]
MDRQQTTIIKGVAILMMLFLHLFNWHRNAMLCTNFVFVGDVPLVEFLARAANPVAFFLFLGGYGLYRVYQRGGDGHRWTRVFKLYLHYWIILAIFLVIGHYMAPEKYPGSLLRLLYGITAFAPTYNGEMWFLFPYVCLSLLSPWLFRVVARWPSWLVVGVSLCVNVFTSFCISRYGVDYLYDDYRIYNPLLLLHMSYDFMLGAMAARQDWISRIHRAVAARTSHVTLVAVLCLVATVAVACVFKYNVFYALIVIVCLCMMRLPTGVAGLLASLGRQSMNMWMIHTWLCYYLFHDFIYSFAYPAVIFIVTLSLSYAIGLIVDAASQPVERRLLSRAERRAKVYI